MLGEKNNITPQYNKTKIYLNKDFYVSAILFIFSKQHSIENSCSCGSNSQEFLLLTSQVPIFYFIARSKFTKSRNQLGSANKLLQCVKDTKWDYFTSKTSCSVKKK